MNHYKIKRSPKLNRYIVEELGDPESRSAAPPPKRSVYEGTAEQILDHMFEDEGAHFYSEKVPHSETPKTSRAPQRKR